MKAAKPSASFLKKRSKKLSSIGVSWQRRGEAMGEVFLLLFFQKKKTFLPLPDLASPA
jgi:hypothetical protein